MSGPLAQLGKVLLGAGLGLAAVGGLLLLSERYPWLRLGRLPGDLSIERDGFRFYLPLATSVLVSAVVSLLFWLWSRWR
jgi:hypothetical protein